MSELPLGITEVNTPHYQTVSGYKFPTLQQAIKHQLRENLVEFFDNKSELLMAECVEAADCILRNPQILPELIILIKKYNEHNI